MFNKELEFKWQDHNYTVLVTMDLLESVDNKFNLVQAVGQLTTGEVKFVRLSKFLSFVISKAGGDVSSESIYTDIFGSSESALGEAIALANHVLAAFFPDPETEKKS